MTTHDLIHRCARCREMDCPIRGQIPVIAEHGCKMSDQPLPSLATQAKNLAVATARDVLAGRPRRTPEECEEIFQVHCKGRDTGQRCEFLRTDERCAKCGCPLREKIPMAREHCPAGKW